MTFSTITDVPLTDPLPLQDKQLFLNISPAITTCLTLWNSFHWNSPAYLVTLLDRGQTLEPKGINKRRIIYIYIYIYICMYVYIYIYNSSFVYTFGFKCLAPVDKKRFSGFAYGVTRCANEFHSVRRVVIAGEIFRNSCLSWRGSGSVNGTSVIVEKVIKSSFCLFYVLFVAASTVYHVNKFFGATVN